MRNYQIVTNPRAQLYAYTDHFGNAVYYFNVLREHWELRIEAQSVIEVKDLPPLPDAADSLEWQRYNSFNLTAEHYDFLGESTFATGSAQLQNFIEAHGLEKPKGDPLTALKQLNEIIYAAFDYEVGVTEVHSPIDKALGEKRGVCQDFAHIMIAIARSWGVPARYVSGYLYHRRQDKNRSGEDATHAWVEAYLPSMGWIGFDPTNNILASERHLRAAAGRDYADVPPTRGTFKGDAESELAVAVTMEPTAAPVRHEEFLRVARPIGASNDMRPTNAENYYQQQQQQQQ
ncbi:MAG: transglutaminase family protein [Alphaproteobacteria bacterium]|nr:transglutaminase family protein [Alphaproteobacteria bacterium]